MMADSDEGDPAASAVVFPSSQSVEMRRLRFRNNTDAAFVVKIIPTSPILVKLSRTDQYVGPQSSAIIDMQLDPSVLDNLNEMDTGHHLLVYCMNCVLPSAYDNVNTEKVTNWLLNDAYSPCELVQKLAIVRSPGFAAFETILDLPGHAYLIYPVSVPRRCQQNYVSKCDTAHHVDSDATTICALTRDEMLALLPSDHMLNTCHTMTHKPQTVMPRSVTMFITQHQQRQTMCMWMTQMFRLIFPPPPTTSPRASQDATFTTISEPPPPFESPSVQQCITITTMATFNKMPTEVELADIRVEPFSNANNKDGGNVTLKNGTKVLESSVAATDRRSH